MLKAMREKWTKAEVLKEGSMGGVRRWTWFAQRPMGELVGSQKGKRKVE